jgi:hypothetical protein
MGTLSDATEDIEEFIMIDHFGFTAGCFPRNAALREHASAPLGLAIVIAGGGMENRPSALRASCHPDNGGASVTNPDGHNVEAVCHAVE